MKNRITMFLLLLIMTTIALCQECAECNKKLSECTADLKEVTKHAKTIALSYEDVKIIIDEALKSDIREYNHEEYKKRLEMALQKQKRKNTANTAIVTTVAVGITYFIMR